MSAAEREAFEAELAAGRQDYIDQVKQLEAAAMILVSASEPVSPDPSIREKLLKEIVHPAPISPALRKQVWRQWASDDANQDLFTLRAAEGLWEDTGVSGVRVRRLFVD